MIKELRAFPDAVAVDPRNCGCTECLIGEYVNLGDWEDRATAADVAAVLSGEVSNHTYSSLFDLVFNTYFSEDSANDFVRRAKESLESEFSAIDTERLISLSL